MWSFRFKRCYNYNVTNMYILFIFKPFGVRKMLILTMKWHNKVLRNILFDFDGSKSIYENVPYYWQRWYCFFDTTQVVQSPPPKKNSTFIEQKLSDECLSRSGWAFQASLQKRRIKINSFTVELVAARDKKILPSTASQTNTPHGLVVICMRLF